MKKGKVVLDINDYDELVEFKNYIEQNKTRKQYVNGMFGMNTIWTSNDEAVLDMAKKIIELEATIKNMNAILNIKDGITRKQKKWYQWQQI